MESSPQARQYRELLRLPCTHCVPTECPLCGGRGILYIERGSPATIINDRERNSSKRFTPGAIVAFEDDGSELTVLEHIAVHPNLAVPGHRERTFHRNALGVYVEEDTGHTLILGFRIIQKTDVALSRNIP